MLQYLCRICLRACVGRGSGVCFDGGAPLPSFFEVILQLLDSLFNSLRFVDCILQTIGIQYLFAFVIEADADLVGARISRRTTQFLRRQIITSLSSDIILLLCKTKVNPIFLLCHNKCQPCKCCSHILTSFEIHGFKTYQEVFTKLLTEPMNLCII